MLSWRTGRIQADLFAGILAAVGFVTLPKAPMLPASSAAVLATVFPGEFLILPFLNIERVFVTKST
jgi:hypothetical protein